MLERIIQLFGTDNQSAISQKTGIKLQTLNHIFKGRNRTSIDVISKIHAAMPEVSLNWLIYGEGEMYITHTPHLYDYIPEPLPCAAESTPLPEESKEKVQECISKLSMVSTNNKAVIAQLEELKEQNDKIMQCILSLQRYI